MKTRREALAALGAALTVGYAHRGWAADTRASVRIMFAIDSSNSVRDPMFDLQVRGTAEGLASPEIVRIVEGLRGGADVLAYTWGDALEVKQLLPWTSVRNATDCARAAGIIAGAKRPFHSLSTNISWALWCARRFNANAPREALRSVLDISGDGRLNVLVVSVRDLHDETVPVGTLAEERAKTLLDGITINAIAIPGREPGLTQYHREQVIGGPGSFAIEVADEHEYAAALRYKMGREIA